MNNLFSWIYFFNWALIKFFAFKGGCLSFINTPPIVNPLASMCVSNNLEKSKNFNINVIESFFLQLFEHFLLFIYHSNDNSFLKRSINGLANVEKKVMNFLWKFTNSRKDFTPFVVTRLCHFLMAWTFFRLGLVPFWNNKYIRKFIFNFTNSLFIWLS